MTDRGVLVKYRCRRQGGTSSTKNGVWQVLLTTTGNDAYRSGMTFTRENISDMVLDVCIYKSPGLGIKADGTRRSAERVGLDELDAELGNYDDDYSADDDDDYRIDVDSAKQKKKRVDATTAVIRLLKIVAETRAKGQKEGRGHGIHQNAYQDNHRRVSDSLEIRREVERDVIQRRAISRDRETMSCCQSLWDNDDIFSLILAMIQDVTTLVACSAVSHRWRAAIGLEARICRFPQGLRLYGAPRRKLKNGWRLRPKLQKAASQNALGALKWFAARLPGVEALSISDLNGISTEGIDEICRECPKIRSLQVPNPRFRWHYWGKDQEGYEKMKKVQTLAAFPLGVVGLQFLVTLDLSCQEIKRIPTRLDLPQLRELDLTRNNLGHDNGADSFAIVGCPRLEILQLGVNEFEDFPQSIQSLSSLRKLDLGENSIERIPVPLNLPNLKELNLEANLLGNNNGSNSFAVVGCPKLQLLDAHYNLWGEIFPTGILEHSRNLRRLDLDIEEFIALPDEIVDLMELVDLNLGDCGNLAAFPDKLPPKLEDLNLNCCVSLDPFHLGSPLSTVALTLKTLDLNEVAMNILENLNDDSWLNGICGCVNLELLNLGCCYIVELPPRFAHLVNLKSLFLANNRLEKFPSALREFRQLKWLDLEDNKLKDVVPEWLSELTLLKYCDLSSNNELPPLSKSLVDSMPAVRFVL